MYVSLGITNNENFLYVDDHSTVAFEKNAEGQKNGIYSCLLQQKFPSSLNRSNLGIAISLELGLPTLMPTKYPNSFSI